MDLKLIGLALAATLILAVGFFRRRHARRRPAPPWASFFRGDEFSQFISQVRRYFDGRGQKASGLEEGVVRVDFQGREQAFGLLNLAQTCRQCPAKDWPRVIQAHFSKIFQVLEENEAFRKQVPYYEMVRDKLAVRLWLPDHLNAISKQEPPEKNAVFRSDLEGTFTTLVFDLPSAIQNVKPEDAASWGKSREELFAAGLENVKRICKPKVMKVNAAPGVDLSVFYGNEFYVASYALLLKELPQAAGKHGALVGIPTAQMLMCYPIEDAKVMEAMVPMIGAIRGRQKEGPQSLSANLYWCRDGAVTLLPYELAGSKLTFSLPDAFTQLLNGLGVPYGG